VTSKRLAIRENEILKHTNSAAASMETRTYGMLALLSVVVFFLYLQLYNWRLKKYRHIPHAYPNSLVFGHLMTIGKAASRLGDSRRHPGQFLSIVVVRLSLNKVQTMLLLLYGKSLDPRK
jgi:hypothetical protein